MVSGFDCFEALPSILKAIISIAQDERIRGAYADAEDKTKAAVEVARVICVDHKEDALALLAAVNGMTEEEYAEHLTSPLVLMRDMTALLQTELVRDFL